MLGFFQRYEKQLVIKNMSNAYCLPSSLSPPHLFFQLPLQQAFKLAQLKNCFPPYKEEKGSMMGLIYQIKAATKATYTWYLSLLCMWMPISLLLYLYWSLRLLFELHPLPQHAGISKPFPFVPLQRTAVDQFVLKVAV